MFQFRRFPTYTYLIQCTLHGYCPCGLPHSEIHGSMDICSSPWLIAACHVLRRLLMPRHSPFALYSLTNRKQHSLFSFVNYAGFTDSWNCNRYPSIRCSTIKITSLLCVLSRHRPLCCLTYHFCYIVQFSRCIAFQPLLKSDWNTQSLECFNLISMVEISGIEPLTSCLQGRRSPSWAKPPSSLFKSGGPEWARTTDLTIISRTL